jgi:transketolase
MTAEAIRAAQELDKENLNVRVLDLHTIKPLDRDAIRKAAAETRAIVVAEEHLVDGGLGVRVAQMVAETEPCAMEFVGIEDTYAESGSPEALLEKYGLTSAKIIDAVRRVVSRKK